ncbi:SEC14-like protein 3 [Ditylenchus destructor]|nr:SEC14-like protein 3 [Ditylenchus destructor]
MIWSIAKPLLPERTKNKVKILGSNWRKEILDIAIPEALPSYWNEPTKETIFHANIERAVPVDQSRYYKAGPIHNTATLSIPAGNSGFVEIVAEKSHILSWTFTTDGHFAYAVYFSEDPKEHDTSKMLLIYPRFNKVPGPTFVPIKDYMECDRTGVYKFWFSNEHAWFHTLVIKHKIEVNSVTQ